MDAGEPSTNRGVVAAAARRVLPIFAGYVPVGLAFGVLAREAGLSMFQAGAMSVMVYAGSAQLIAVGLFAAGAPALAVVLTTFVVNLRHLLMSAALAPYLSRWPARLIALFTFEMTDETFALHSAAFGGQGQSRREAICVNLMAHSTWVLASVAGFAAGALIPDAEAAALDFALPAMFIALLLPQIKSRLHLAAAVLAGALSVALMYAGLDQWAVILATVLSATACTVVLRCRMR